MATISETKRHRTFNLYSIYRFCEAYISEKVLPNVPHHSIRHCERHFTKWRPFPKYYGLSQKLRGAERSMLTLCIGFVGRRFQKNYCQMYHTILSDIVNAILQNGGHFQSITVYQKLRGAERSMLTLCIGFVGRRFQKKYCQIHHAIISAILEAIFQKMAAFFQSNTSYL